MKSIKFILIPLLTLIFTHTAHAQENFDITSYTQYSVDREGETQVEQTITITNNTEFVHAPTYTTILGIEGVREMQVTSDESSLPFTVNDTENGGKQIEVVFPQRVVGMGRENTFTISFKTDEIAEKLGQVWEVNIPGIQNIDNFTKYDINVSVPTSFGEASIIKSSAPDSPPTAHTYTFNKNTIGKSGVLIIFGEQEHYALDLKYKVSNSNFFPIHTEIALPPKTAYQDMVIKNITPQPQKIYIDEDGNYMAEYKLNPQERKEIKANIIVKTFSKPQYTQELTQEQKNNYLRQQKYWETEHQQIQKLAKELQTPENIYNYTANKLAYNTERITSENTRLGASGTLSQKQNAVCLEFTDLFVALARAAGIPARSVEGYAYTNNSSLRPLLRVNDVLHTWPQYYDEERRMWVMVDPTWGNTTSGIDYFHTFDFSHITFVTKGIDSTYPIPAGGYKDKDSEKVIHATFADASEFQKIESMTAEFVTKEALPLFNPNTTIRIKNNGNTTIENKDIIVRSELQPQKQEFRIESIPPYGEVEIPVEFEKVNILTNDNFETTIHFDGQKVSENMYIGYFSKNIITIGGGSIGTVAVLTFTYKTGSVFIRRRRR